MIRMLDEQISDPLSQGDRRQEAGRCISSMFLVEWLLHEGLACAGPPMTTDAELPEGIRATRLIGKIKLRTLLDVMTVFCAKTKTRLEDLFSWAHVEAPVFLKLVENRKEEFEDITPDPERINSILIFYGDIWKSQTGEDIGMIVN
jgi:hypothetical protein